METLEVIIGRTSIRQYTDRVVDDRTLYTILEAGMSGPSCVNARDWSFLAIRNPETLDKMAQTMGRAAQPLTRAKLAILVCGDLERAFSRAPEYWVIDGAIAAQNMILAARSLGLGSVWLGTWPQMGKVESLQKLFDLPDNQIPHSVIAFGYPNEAPEKGMTYEENRVHFEKW